MAGAEYLIKGPSPPARHSAGVRLAPSLLAPLISEAARRRLDLRAIFRGLELEASDFNEPSLAVSHKEAMTLVRRTLRLMVDSGASIQGLGLELGALTTITEHGVLALGVLSAPTLGEAMRLTLRFPYCAGHLLLAREELTPDTHQLIVEPYLGDQDLQDFLVDLTFSAVLHLRREVTRTNYTPYEVELVQAAPAKPCAYEARFGCPVWFGRPRNLFKTTRNWLSFSMPWASTRSYQLSLQLLKQDAERFSSISGLGLTIERVIRRNLPRVTHLTDVAASLNLSERTLRRQLAQSGLSFRALLDDCRKSRALDLLATGHRSLAELASEAGFSDARSFTRAFKRWTGHAPTLSAPEDSS